MELITAYFDGCCEPVNPGGTAAFGAVVFINSERVWECSRIFRPMPGREKETSNNVAEYSGFLAILDYLKDRDLHRKPIRIYGDSKLVIEQMFGRWKIKQGHYVPLALRARSLLKEFPNLRGEWISRDENSIADELSKRELINAGVTFKIQPN